MNMKDFFESVRRSFVVGFFAAAFIIAAAILFNYSWGIMLAIICLVIGGLLALAAWPF